MTDKDASDDISPATLDPEDWQAFRARAHAMLDHVVDHMESVRDGRVWTPVPAPLREKLGQPLDAGGVGGEALDEALRALMPHGVGNTHPRFFGWVHGAGTPSGMLAEMVAAGMNANCGGRDHAGIHVERQLTGWIRDLFGFPETASGLNVSGTSMATIIALKTARDAALSFRSRREGVDGCGLVAYSSEEAHSCIARAMDMLGLGDGALRKLPVDSDFRLQPGVLERAIRDDVAQGLTPFAVIATAGTVNTGAIDPLEAVREISARHGLWLHVDAAFGASGILSEKLKTKLKGIESADSLAFDFHKWMHVNYDAGFVMIRDGAMHRKAFTAHPEYLQGSERGLAAGQPWPVDYGPELSRGFRALKVWAHLLEHGPDRVGAAVSRNCEQAAYLASLVDASPRLERLAPVETSISCFRYIPAAIQDESAPDRLNADIVIALQESGIAAPSTTRIGGRLAIRVNITNHRTRFSDLDLLVSEIIRLGGELSSSLGRNHSRGT